MITKNDIIQDAYSEMRISGITVNPTPGDGQLALVRLESMMAEFYGRTMCIGYLFEDVPTATSPSGIELTHKHMSATNLAIRLHPDFGKQPNPILIAQASQSYTASSAIVARERLKQVQPSSRMPRGSGNRRSNRWRRFYPETVTPVSNCDNVEMVVGEIDDFTEDFTAYLSSHGGSIASFTIEASGGLRVLVESEVQLDGDLNTLCGDIWSCVGTGTLTGTAASLPAANDAITQPVTLLTNVDYRIEIDVVSAGSTVDVVIGKGNSLVGIGNNEVTVNSGQVDSVLDNTIQFKAFSTGSNVIESLKVFEPFSYVIGDGIHYRIEATGSGLGFESDESVTLTITTSTGRVKTQRRSFTIQPTATA